MIGYCCAQPSVTLMHTIMTLVYLIHQPQAIHTLLSPADSFMADIKIQAARRRSPGSKQCQSACKMPACILARCFGFRQSEYSGRQDLATLFHHRKWQQQESVSTLVIFAPGVKYSARGDSYPANHLGHQVPKGAGLYRWKNKLLP